MLDVRGSADGAAGMLALRPRGLARVVAATEDARLRLQAQLLPTAAVEDGWRAAELFLQAAVAQIEGLEAAAGCAPEQGVAWVEVAGPPGDAPRLALVAAAVGAAALGRANALLTDATLARAYLHMRCDRPAIAAQRQAEGGEEDEHRAVEATGRDGG